MKKTLLLMLVIAMLVANYPVNATAALSAEESAAERLFYYEILKGTDNGLELDRELTRLEAVVIMVRLSGLTCSESYSHPFLDVPEWADREIAVAYEYGLAKGISSTELDSFSRITFAQFITLSLRALEYDDSYGVFDWDNPWVISDFIGLSDGGAHGDYITRGDMSLIAYRLLSRTMNGYFKLGGHTRYAFSKRYGSINSGEKADEGLNEFGMQSPTAAFIYTKGMGGEIILAGSDVDFLVGDTYEASIYCIEGGEITWYATDSDIINIVSAGVRVLPGVDEDEVKYNVYDITITPLKTGKAAIVAKSSDGELQSLHITALDER